MFMFMKNGYFGQVKGIILSADSGLCREFEKLW